MLRRITLLLSTAVPLLAATCTGGGGEPAGGPGTPPALALRLELAANLEPFDGCQEVLDYFEESAEDLGRTGGGVPGIVTDVVTDVVTDFGPGAVGPRQRVVADSVSGGEAGSAMRVTSGEASGSAVASQPGGGAAAGGPDFSPTNIQERGVDEPDLVKTDGRRIVAVARGRLQVVEPSGSGIRTLGSVALPEGAHELFLVGDRAVVLSRSYQAVALEAPAGAGGRGAGDDAVASMIVAPDASATVVSAVDLSDPSQPRVTESATFEGDYVAARLHEGVVRLVLRSSPWFSGAPEGTTLEQWLPDQVVGAGTSSPRTEPLVGCDAVARPPEPSGVGTVTVLTIDASGSMQPIDSDAVVADAQTVYASTETLYVATNQWLGGPDDPAADAITTELHAFDIGDPRQTTYVGSGRVRGQLLNQWSLSEHDGHLRVATTDGSPWAVAETGERSSESFLTVLRRQGDKLETVGQLGGLGRGEQIYAVRYFGDLGFVVTFRQTDPLYAIDLSEPAAPRLVGELKIPGFSAYLHPVGEGRLLGVGQDATEEGRQLGTQVSLFDVSDPSSLRRLDQAGIENASSAVEHDHRAFLWWGPRGLALLPVEIYTPVPVPLPGPGTEPGAEPGIEIAPDVAAVPYVGAAAFRVAGDGVAEVGRLTHGDKVQGGADQPGYYGAPAIQRALVVGDTLYTVSEAGVMASDLGSLDEQGWAAF